MNIHKATKSYESWMRSCMPVVNSDLSSKHSQMRKSLFLFLRGTFYRWAQLWPEVCSELCGAPKVLAVGDLHVGSFGTWRDAEGRICWGVDDFDESYPLPYTSDLVRLAASVKIGIDSEHLALSLKDGCDAILEGYQETLKKDGCPFVLAENEQYMEKLGIEAIKAPEDSWRKLTHLPAVHRGIPRDAKRALESTLPKPLPHYQVVRRHAGLGSLGQHRFVAIANWEGGTSRGKQRQCCPRPVSGSPVARSITNHFMSRQSNEQSAPGIHFKK